MNDLKRMDRRQAIKWMLAATATVSVLDARSLGAAPAIRGYGADPKVMEAYQPGELWPLTLTAEQHRVVAALCDVIIPADEKSPSASQVKVPDFVDEWISAPYPAQQTDRKLILEGLSWIEAESNTRFKKSFAALNGQQQHQVCDDICYLPKARPRFRRGARFFAKFRDLTTTGFYTTPEGMKDIQYVGNVPVLKWDGPPPEVLAYLKFA